MEESGVGANVPTIPAPPVNPLMTRIQMPGETFPLPSGGLFYKDGELDETVKNAEVHVHPMTAIDEITIKTPDLLFSGEAVKQVFSRCIPQIRDVDGMLAKDVDYLLVCLRKVSYGDELRLEHKHNCENAQSHTYSIDISNFIRSAKRIDPTSITTKFVAKMPNQQTVHMQPIRYREFIRVMQMNDPNEMIDPVTVRDQMLESVSNIIVSVDEVTDNGMIREWLNSVTPQFLKAINDNIDKTLEWGPEFETQVKCADCSQPTKIVAPLNPLYFFT